MSRAPVLVTGAGGFIGGAVARRLAADGRPVLAGLRRSSFGQAEAGGLRHVICDLDEVTTLAAAVDGAEAVVHAAVGPPDRMEAQVAALLAAADRAGVRRFVLFSSIAVYGERGGVVREGDAPSGRLGPYGTAKLRCEELVRRWAEVPGLHGQRGAAVLRPGIVYGRGSRFWIDDLVARIRSGGWGTFGAAGDGIAALVHVDDVAEATLLALDAVALPGDAALNLTGPDQPTWNGYFTALAARLGRAPLRDIGPCELKARQAVALPAKLLARCGLPMPIILARTPLPSEMQLFGRRATYAADRAAALLGWTARVGLAEGLIRSLPAQASNT